MEESVDGWASPEGKAEGVGGNLNAAEDAFAPAAADAAEELAPRSSISAPSVSRAASSRPSAAAADPPTPPAGAVPALAAAPLRKGKWTAEEEAYTTAIIADFSRGCGSKLSSPNFFLCPVLSRLVWFDVCFRVRCTVATECECVCEM